MEYLTTSVAEQRCSDDEGQYSVPGDQKLFSRLQGALTCISTVGFEFKATRVNELRIDGETARVLESGRVQQQIVILLDDCFHP